jgi:hypothetical protein
MAERGLVFPPDVSARVETVGLEPSQISDDLDWWFRSAGRVEDNKWRRGSDGSSFRSTIPRFHRSLLEMGAGARLALDLLHGTWNISTVVEAFQKRGQDR